MSECKCPAGYPQERRSRIISLKVERTRNGPTWNMDWPLADPSFILERYHVYPCLAVDEVLAIETTGFVDLPVGRLVDMTTEEATL